MAASRAGGHAACVNDEPVFLALPCRDSCIIITCDVQETALALSSNVQYRLGARELVGVRASVNPRGRAGISFKVRPPLLTRSHPPQMGRVCLWCMCI